MRITTQMLYQSSLARLSEQQNSLLQTQNEIATGRRVTTPSDDPVAAAQIVGVAAADARASQFKTNRSHAESALGLQESVLTGVGAIIQDAQTAVIAAGNATWTDSERKVLATELRGRLSELVGLANTVDTDGQAIFGGYDGARQPFVVSGGEVRYQGDAGSRAIQVAEGRQIPVTTSGQTVFEAIRTGNGRFAVSAPAGNTGDLLIGASSVSDASLLTGDDYRVDFSVVAGVASYSITNISDSLVVASGLPYTAGDSIDFDGMQFAVSGNPADGDRLEVGPSRNQSLFKTLENLVAALETPVVGEAGRAAFRNQLNAVHDGLGNAQDTVLATRAAVGGRLNEIDSLADAGEDLVLQYQKTLSELRDTDYNEAVSRLARQQLGLQAAQQTFTRIAGLSLFEYL